MQKKLAAIILAAGKGTRMQSELPKVLVELSGKPLLGYVIELTQAIGCEKIVTVVGYKKELVTEFAKQYNTEFAVQEEQHGTGHAVMMAEDAMGDFDGNVIVLIGDAPLLQISTIKNYIAYHESIGSSATILSGIFENPFNYGRILRDDNQNVLGIVEEKDATEEQKKIQEINSGILIFNARELFASLKKISNNNAKNEYYLVDVIEILRNEGKKVAAYVVENAGEIAGVNTPEQLQDAENILASFSK